MPPDNIIGDTAVCSNSANLTVTCNKQISFSKTVCTPCMHVHAPLGSKTGAREPSTTKPSRLPRHRPTVLARMHGDLAS